MDTEAPADLRTIYAPIGEDLARLRAYLDREFASREPFIARILEHVARFRGKQLRPALLFLVSRLAGGRLNDDEVKIAAVIELIHTATLVHDDILDDAALRRNLDTVHRRWGERAAVLIGDYIYSRAFHISTEVPGMASVLSDATNTICEGELLQIENRYHPDMGEGTYLDIIRKKTAVLYAVACRLGGVLGGLGTAGTDVFERFGLDLGMAFQIADDCLDYSGKESETGKSLGTDLRQGKVTLPLIYLMECLEARDAAWLRSALERPLDAAVRARICALVEEHGVLRDALGRADAYIQSAKATLGENVVLNGASRELRESLEAISDYVVRRQR